jgi:hypothetical protein
MLSPHVQHLCMWDTSSKNTRQEKDLASQLFKSGHCENVYLILPSFIYIIF